MTQLYRHFDTSGALLYVGISLSAVARATQHRTLSGWWDQIARIEIENHPSREAALAAERAAIKGERPLYNKRHNEPERVLSPEPPPSTKQKQMTRDLLAHTVVKLKPVYNLLSASELLDCSTSEVKRLIASGRLSAFEGAKGRWRITGWAMLDYLESRS